MLELATICGRLTVWRVSMGAPPYPSGEKRTKHAQEVLRAVDRAHLLLLPDDDRRARHVLFADLRVLRALEAVEQVRAERAVEVRLQARDDRRQQDLRVFQPMGERQRHSGEGACGGDVLC